MKPIQQVILAVVADKTNWRCGVVGSTDSVNPVDLQELVDWFSDKTPDSAFRFEVTNLFFHPLPSGNYTIGRMIPQTGSLFSFLNNQRSFYVQHLIVSPETLLLYANNPITLFQKIHSHGAVQLFHKPPKTISPIVLPKPSASIPLVDQRLMNELSVNPGPKALSILLQATLDSVCTFFTGGPATIRVISGLFNMFPISWRPELTFSTELHFSRSRPLKLVGVSGGTNMFRMNSSDIGISFCDLAAIKRAENQTITLLDAWPLFMYHVLRNRNFSFLQDKLKQEFIASRNDGSAYDLPGTDPDELRILANKWFAGLLDSEKSKQSLPKPNRSDKTDNTVFVFPDFNKEESHAVSDRLTDILAQEKSEDEKQNFAEIEGFQTKFEEKPEVHETVELPGSLATLIQQKVVRVNDSVSSPLLKRINKYPFLKDELKWLESCVARVLLGDHSALVPFRICWNGICSRLDSMQQLALAEDYIILVRDFMNQHSLRNDPRLLERDIDIMELLDVILSM